MFGLSKKITTSSLISTDMFISGTIKSESEIYNDGVIEGDVDCKILIIGINGRVKSNTVHAEKVIVYGLVDGNIDASSVYLGASARVNGSIIHKDIQIETGAFISGEIKQKRSGVK